MTAAITVILTLVLSVMRGVLELFSIDPSTGFYTGMPVLVTVQNILYLVSLAALCLLCWREKRAHAALQVHKYLGAVLLLCGLAALYAGSDIGRQVQILLAQGGGARVMGSLARLLALLSGILFLWTGTRLLRGFDGRVPILAAALPAVLLAARAVERFLDSPTIASISVQTLEVSACCAGALFFLCHARAISREGLVCSASAAKAAGLAFSLLSVSVTVGELCATAAGRPAPDADFGQTLFLLLLGIYAGLFACGVRYQKES